MIRGSWFEKRVRAGSCQSLPTHPFALNRIEEAMSNTAVILADMGVLVVIFLAGLLAKLYPRKRNGARQ